MIPEEKLALFEKIFTHVVDKGAYLSCTMEGKKREWMYSHKLIQELSAEKIEKLIKNQT